MVAEPAAQRAEVFPHLTQRADIQGLRALAGALVILDHSGIPFLPGGFVGVDVFFVVSGYLITMLLLREAVSTGKVSIIAFYARRARRILPAATVVLVGLAAFAAWFMPLSRAQQTLSDVVWAAFFGANIHFGIQGTDYFQQGLPPSPVQHFWSLAVEEQFYLVWPALLALILLVGRRRHSVGEVASRTLPVVTGVVVTGWVASLVWSVLLTTREPTAAYFSTPARAWELATGALLALGAHRLAATPRLLRHVLAVGGLAAIGVSAVWITPEMGFPGYVALVPVLGTAAVLAAGASGDAVGVARVLTVRPVTWVGDISYSLYLWHWPALILGGLYVGVKRGPLETVVLVGAAVAASAFSYHVVENPFRRPRTAWIAGRRGVALWPVAITLTVASVLAAQVEVDHSYARLEAGGTGFRPSQLPVAERVKMTGNALHDALALGVDEMIARAPIPLPAKNGPLDLGADRFDLGDCISAPGHSDQPICRLGSKKGGRTIVVWGDSQAEMWLPGLNKAAKAAGVTVIPLIKYGCAPFDVPWLTSGRDPASMCVAFRDWALQQVAMIHPDLVLLVGRANPAQIPRASDGQRVQAWKSGVAATVRRIVKLGVKAEAFSQIPTLSPGPEVCLTSSSADMDVCSGRVTDLERSFDRATRRAARSAGGRYVNTLPLLCIQGRCPIVADRIITYFSSDHVSKTWALRVAGRLGRLAGVTG